MAAVEVVNDYLQGLPGDARRLAHAEWGRTIPARFGSTRSREIWVHADLPGPWTSSHWIACSASWWRPW